MRGSDSLYLRIFMKKTTNTKVSHSSDFILDKGSELVAFIEEELEKTYSEHFNWADMYKRNKSSQTFQTLHTIFQLHKDYAFLNIESQKDLITDIDIDKRSLIIAEIGVVESQKQTIEGLMGSYTAAIFAKQSEIASRRANTLSLLGILVAVTAVVISDLRLHALIK
jgi:hypothetical protein